jgi:hypothetical protein
MCCQSCSFPQNVLSIIFFPQKVLSIMFWPTECAAPHVFFHSMCF